MLQYKELLAVCVEGLNNFKPESQSVEDYIKNFLKLKKVRWHSFFLLKKAFFNCCRKTDCGVTFIEFNFYYINYLAMLFNFF